MESKINYWDYGDFIDCKELKLAKEYLGWGNLCIKIRSIFWPWLNKFHRRILASDSSYSWTRRQGDFFVYEVKIMQFWCPSFSWQPEAAKFSSSLQMKLPWINHLLLWKASDVDATCPSFFSETKGRAQMLILCLESFRIDKNVGKSKNKGSFLS